MILNYRCRDCKVIFKSEEDDVKWKSCYPICNECKCDKGENEEG